MSMRALLATSVLVAGATPAGAVALRGEFWDTPTRAVDSIASARAVIEDRPPDLTFSARALEFPPAGDLVPAETRLDAFLGANATGLDCGGACPAVAGSVFRFTGFLETAPGENVVSLFFDDGFELSIGGETLASYDADVPAGGLTRTARFAGDGLLPVELVYWDGPGGEAVFSARLNDVVIDDGVARPSAPTPIPAPASLPLLAVGLGLAGALARRRRRG